MSSKVNGDTNIAINFTAQCKRLGSQNAVSCISWISSFGWPDDDSLESKHVAVSIMLCNKMLCLTETYILYVIR